MNIADYISQFKRLFPEASAQEPWNVTAGLCKLIETRIKNLGDDFQVSGNMAIHKEAIIEQGVIIKGPVIIESGVFIGAHAYIRGGAYLGAEVSIGPGCEIKSSLLMAKTSVAHFNFVGDSILGENINMEAGSIIANYHNDRDDKTIIVKIGGNIFRTSARKFGALVGDGCKIGANAVLSPGTILEKNTIVHRLELVRQT